MRLSPERRGETKNENDGSIISFELGAVSALTAGVNLRASVDFDYDSSPAEGRKKYDIGFTTALGFRF